MPPIGKIAAHSAYDMFSLYKYLIVSLFFFHLGFWSGNLFLIAPFPGLCLLVPFYHKGPVTGYGKLTWEFAHAWNFMKLCTLIVSVMTAIIMVYSIVNSIPLANYDVIYVVTMIAKGTPL